jgi:hypothetical protein
MELMELRKGANNQYEYDKYSKRMYEIVNESAPIRKYRDMLARAIRANDRDAVAYAQREIQRIVRDESYGKASA